MRTGKKTMWRKFLKVLVVIIMSTSIAFIIYKMSFNKTELNNMYEYDEPIILLA